MEMIVSTGYRQTDLLVVTTNVKTIIIAGHFRIPKVTGAMYNIFIIRVIKL